jgi:putative transposase
VINPAVDDLAQHVGIARACALLGRSRASHYRARRPVTLGPKPSRAAAVNALTPAERAEVLRVLTGDRFVDKSVAQVWATLLDEGTYLCSQSSMHRILRANHAAGERRSQATHPTRTIPELLATRPGQVWSWDITNGAWLCRRSHP